ncbi:hypothetical protein VTJ49DRAFT_3163 [Mycothermus thermophilus]|uniref:Enoyl reductase (ER) domain-containing protein n=1 Tax=Humicola insolens TaxID=85995 RepID=A0ABR3V835_HUMIN
MSPIPKTMSGILVEETGGVEVLQWNTDLPVPTLNDGEVLVRNEDIGVNYIDTYFRTGLYPKPLPFIPGREAAGVIIALHPSVTNTTATTPTNRPPLSVGTRVAYITDQQGAYAELTAVSARDIVPLPPAISSDLAAAALLQGLTALTFIREAAGLKRPPKDDSNNTDGKDNDNNKRWALVHAAAGGTGSLLSQLLTLHGVCVIGTAGSAEKRVQAEKWSGAHTVIDTSSESDLVSRVGEITEGRGVDIIFDGVGKATFELDMQVIARKGTLSGPVPPLDILRLVPKNIKLLRPGLTAYIETQEERDAYTQELFELLAEGTLKVNIHKLYPLKEVAQAHVDLEGRKTIGKLLLKV